MMPCTNWQMRKAIQIASSYTVLLSRRHFHTRFEAAQPRRRTAPTDAGRPPFLPFPPSKALEPELSGVAQTMPRCGDHGRPHISTTTIFVAWSLSGCSGGSAPARRCRSWRACASRPGVSQMIDQKGGGKPLAQNCSTSTSCDDTSRLKLSLEVSMQVK